MNPLTTMVARLQIHASNSLSRFEAHFRDHRSNTSS